jgi:hypothetical protein
MISTLRKEQSQMFSQMLKDAVRVVEPAVIVSGKFLPVSEETTALPAHGLPGGSWTGSAAKGVVHKLEPGQWAIAIAPVTHAFLGNPLWVVCASADTSSPTEDALDTIEHYRVNFDALGRLAVNDALDDGQLFANNLPMIGHWNLIGGKHEFLQPPSHVDRRLAARQRRLLARAGGGVSATQVAQQLNVSEQEVDELRAAGRLLAVPDPDSQELVYPACQFEGPRIVKGLAEGLSDFAIVSPWTRLYVLTSKDPALGGRTPIEALKHGDLDLVRELISVYGEQGGE